MLKQLTYPANCDINKTESELVLGEARERAEVTGVLWNHHERATNVFVRNVRLDNGPIPWPSNHRTGETVGGTGDFRFVMHPGIHNRFCLYRGFDLTKKMGWKLKTQSGRIRFHRFLYKRRDT